MNSSRIALALWALAVAGFVAIVAGSQALSFQLIVAGMAFAILMGLYLLFSLPAFVEAVARFAQDGADYGLPGLLWLGFATLTLFSGAPNALVDIILAGTLLWLPTTLVQNRKEALWPTHALVGLTVLLIPLGIDVVFGAQLGASDVALRAGAFALPVLLVALTTRDQKSRLSFLFIAAVAFLWFSVEFGNLPGLSLPCDAGLIRYMQLAVIVLFLYLMTLSGRLPKLGFTFALTRRDWIETGINLGLFAIIAIPFGLLTGFIRLATSAPALLEIAGRGLAIFFFIALPEEILFRGAIHRYLENVLRWTPRATLLLSSLIFGVAHLNNPPNVGLYLVLASVAGWFYGRTYLRTGKIVPAAIVHLMVDWLWITLFAG